MRFARSVLSTPEVELPPEVWTSAEVERRLAPLYGRLRLPEGRLELMTGIRERRFWPAPIRPSEASAAAGRRALAAAGLGAGDIDLLIHCSVCRDRLEPATAAYVHGLLGLGPQAQILDISNACLGFANATVLAAGLVESGQIRRALVCAGEDGRPLVERTIRTLNEDVSLDRDGIKPFFANLTIGAGAAAAVVARDDLAPAGGFRLRLLLLLLLRPRATQPPRPLRSCTRASPSPRPAGRASARPPGGTPPRPTASSPTRSAAATPRSSSSGSASTSRRTARASPRWAMWGPSPSPPPSASPAPPGASPPATASPCSASAAA